MNESRNWVFLGDSLTEGVGSKRISHVAELAKHLRAHEFRLRRISRPNGQINFNVAGLMNVEEGRQPAGVWLWNLACEGKTIESDFDWLPLIKALRPELVVVFRGSLESIIRPAMVFDGHWPWWVPASWRSYSAMDPRCYLSTSWWRRAKQESLDRLKQRVRLQLLTQRGGKPMVDVEELMTSYQCLLRALKEIKCRILMTSMLPVNSDMFPTSDRQFELVNNELRELSQREQVDFLDWYSAFKRQMSNKELYYRDGFHPNATGAQVLAQELFQYLRGPHHLYESQLHDRVS